MNLCIKSSGKMRTYLKKLNEVLLVQCVCNCTCSTSIETSISKTLHNLTPLHVKKSNCARIWFQYINIKKTIRIWARKLLLSWAFLYLKSGKSCSTNGDKVTLIILGSANTLLPFCKTMNFVCFCYFQISFSSWEHLATCKCLLRRNRHL